ncbi:FecR family protein [Allostella humosa]|uniref:FecR family protein n=1 Tax=Stella humosa TaxID=94 RepID=UPI0014771AC5|nr:FecR domain-containing protein [Stella humosa]
MPQSPAEAIEEDAIAWFVLLRDTDASRDDRARHAAWLAASPAHRAAWQDVGALWGGMDALAPANQNRPPPPRRRHRAAALAACLLLACVGAWAVAPPGLFADERSGVGQRRTVSLADGSSVELGTASALSVHFDGSERRVVLHRGQGYFMVAPEADRPFVVEAAGGRVTAVGTEFDVKIIDDDSRPSVAVAVAEGVVAVSAGRDGRSVRVGAGQGLRYGAALIGPPGAVDIAEATAWRSDRLVFHERPLGQVVRDLERYRWGRILILDPALAAIPVTGVFNARRTDAALDTIAATLPVRVVRVTDLLAIVSPPR